MSVLKDLKPNCEVHGIIAACENMPGCSAYKPGDVLTAKNGKTIEVDNTDAEGRLTLADALCYACELDVDEVIDIATLTGACVVALGSAASGIMGNHQPTIDKLIKCANSGGEKMWQLPMFDEYKESLQSDVADMRNTGSRSCKTLSKKYTGLTLMLPAQHFWINLRTNFLKVLQVQVCALSSTI